MSDLTDQFEQLARRGTPRGGDAVMDAALREVDGDAAEVVAIGMQSDRRRPRRHLSSLVAAAGVAATLFIGTLAFSAFLGAGGGSDSPEGAVRQLADAVSHEDPISAADVLAPEEVQSLDQTVATAEKRAQELQLARSASAPLAGLDLSVDGLNLSTETMADGYVKVTVNGGQLSAHTQADQFSPVVQKALHDSADNSTQVNLATLAHNSDLPTFVMTVQRGGHWYVSAAYTALEYIREANHLPAADFGSGQRAAATLGADSADGAVKQGLEALSRNDWAALIALAPPDEIPVYDYRAALTQLGQDSNDQFAIRSTATETNYSADGNTAKVRLSASGSTESGAWSLDGGCFQPPIDRGQGSSGVVNGGDWCSVPPFFYVLPFYGTQPSVAKQSEITVVRKDGRWFVSPVGTAIDLLDRWISQVTQRQLYTSIGVPQELPADGRITLGTPVKLGDALGGAYVYDLEAHRGDRLLGLVTTDGQSPRYAFSGAEVTVFSPEGKILKNTYSLIDGAGLEIPADGTYKVVVRPYLGTATLTIWPEADAPDAAKHPIDEGSYDGCQPTDNGGMSCSSSGSSSPDAPTGHCVTSPDGTTTCTDSSSISSSTGSSSSSSSSSSNGQSVTPTTATSVPGG